ncbi:MAG: D-ribose pyranase [Verrucomicrobia bacterium]|nr:D-ribose pyranase [Verrucomicrobiota bacterium]MCH8510610.1 D-ribose pyranase [Kiritimatiellia bacterium]
MKRSTILNRELSAAIAALGHGDMLMVCDAGFPVPCDARRIDLAVCRDLPPLEPVLEAIAAECIFEKITVGEEVRDYNEPLNRELVRIFPGITFEYVPHASIMTDLVHKAKYIVRTGAFNPWGNIALHSIPDVPKWFENPEVKVPDWYRDAVE